MTGPYDLAVITLQGTVPSTVATPMRVWTSSLVDAIDDGDLTQPATIVGWGGPVPARRYGDLRDGLFSFRDDPCFLFFENDCEQDWFWHAPKRFQPATQKGDSGGPLYLRAYNDVPFVVGVDSLGRDATFGDANGSETTVWAATATASGNAGFIVEALGGDQDDDGVLDVYDNCAPKMCANRGLPSERCANPDQVDRDGDGVGNVCDNCIDDYNQSQLDYDEDGRGDECDNCVALATAVESADGDADGVGDACDNCLEFPNAPQACLTDATCRGSACLGGRCRDQDDSDQDDWGDACDLCPNQPDDDIQLNSNLDAELRERERFPLLESLADSCDPVPVVALPTQSKPSVELAEVQPGDGVGPDEVVAVRGVNTLGDNVDDQPDASVRLDIAFNHCSCFDDFGNRLSRAQCLGDGLPCSWSGAGDGWNAAAVSDHVGSGGLSTQLFTRGAPTLQEHVWAWAADAQSGNIDASCSAGICETYGILHSEAKRGTERPVSTRDTVYNLRESFELYQTPFYELRNPVDYLPEYSASCQFGGCELWFRPDLLINPYDFVSHYEVPSRIRPLSENLAVSLSRDQAVRVDLGASLSAVLSAPFVAVSPVETGAALRGRAAGVPLAVLLPEHLAFGVRPTQVVVRNGLLDVRAAEEGGVTPPGRLAVVEGPFVRRDYQVSYSAKQGVVYVVGGADEVSSIWRYHTQSDSWNRLVSRGVQPSSRVLSTVVDPAHHTLYILDVQRGRWLSRARLLSIDTVSGSGQVMASWPHLGLHRSLHLGLLASGELALVAGARTHHSVWRLRVDGPNARVVGFKPGRGEVFDRPFSSLHDLVLPVLRDGAVGLEDIGVEALSRGSRPCHAL